MNDIEPVKTNAFLGKARYFAEELVAFLTQQGQTLALAESCTAGLAADFIVRLPGVSMVFWGSYVCYSVDAKYKMLEIPEELILKHGAVSRYTAVAMAEGALQKSGASMSISITGLAGPGGDDSGAPVGTVWTGFARRTSQGLVSTHAAGFLFEADPGPPSRNDIREAAAAAAFEEILKSFCRISN